MTTPDRWHRDAEEALRRQNAPKKPENGEKGPKTPENADIRPKTPEYTRLPPTSPGFGVGGIAEYDLDGVITSFQLFEVSLVADPPHPDWRILRVSEDQEC